MFTIFLCIYGRRFCPAESFVLKLLPYFLFLLYNVFNGSFSSVALSTDNRMLNFVRCFVLFSHKNAESDWFSLLIRYRVWDGGWQSLIKIYAIEDKWRFWFRIIVISFWQFFLWLNLWFVTTGTIMLLRIRFIVSCIYGNTAQCKIETSVLVCWN